MVGSSADNEFRPGPSVHVRVRIEGIKAERPGKERYVISLPNQTDPRVPSTPLSSVVSWRDTLLLPDCKLVQIKRKKLQFV